MSDDNDRFPCNFFDLCKKAVETFSAARFEKLETSVKAMEARFHVELQAVQDKFQIRSEQVDKRMDILNEFRGALTDREASYFTRQEHLLYEKGVDADLRMLRETKADGKNVEADLRILRESRAEMQGKASQSSLTTTFVIAIIGDVVALAALMFAIFRH